MQQISARQRHIQESSGGGGLPRDLPRWIQISDDDEPSIPGYEPPQEERAISVASQTTRAASVQSRATESTFPAVHTYPSAANTIKEAYQTQQDPPVSPTNATTTVIKVSLGQALARQAAKAANPTLPQQVKTQTVPAAADVPKEKEKGSEANKEVAAQVAGEKKKKEEKKRKRKISIPSPPSQPTPPASTSHVPTRVERRQMYAHQARQKRQKAHQMDFNRFAAMNNLFNADSAIQQAATSLFSTQQERLDRENHERASSQSKRARKEKK